MKKWILVAVCLVLMSGCATLQPRADGLSPAAKVVNTVRAVNAASAGVNPYAVPIEVVLASVSGMIAAYAGLKRKQLGTVSKKYTAHKRGVEQVMRLSEPITAELLYTTIGEERKKLKI